MSKFCSVNGCGRPVFARKFCHYHYKSLYLALKPKPPPKIYIIAPRSKKRAKEEVMYNNNRKVFIERKRALNEQEHIFCYFCGRRLFKQIDLHHMIGRDGDDLLLEEFWVLAHSKCHEVYHNVSAHKIYWFKDYLERVKTDYPTLYFYESNKLEK